MTPVRSAFAPKFQQTRAAAAESSFRRRAIEAMMPERAIEAGMAASDKEAGPRSSLTFRFRGRTVALDRFAPRTTLLDWLREEAGAKGTKEGCARGRLRRLHRRAVAAASATAR